jgi:hypothetical protein
MRMVIISRKKTTRKLKTIYRSFPLYKTISYIRGSLSMIGFLIRIKITKLSKNKYDKCS